MSSPEATPRALLGAFGALLVLLLGASLVPQLPPGPWSAALSLMLATAKTAVIFLFFMQLRYRRGLVRIFAVAGFFWLALAMTLVLADYLTR